MTEKLTTTPDSLIGEPLLPCPFCSGKAWEYVNGSSLVCACHSCGAQITRALVPPAEWHKAVTACRKAWNTRSGLYITPADAARECAGND